MIGLKIIILLLSGLLIYVGAYHGIYKRRIPKARFSEIEIKGSMAFIMGFILIALGISGIIRSF